MPEKIQVICCENSEDKLFTVWEKTFCVVSTKDRVLLGCLEIGTVQTFRVRGESLLF